MHIRVGKAKSTVIWTILPHSNLHSFHLHSQQRLQLRYTLDPEFSMTTHTYTKFLPSFYFFHHKVVHQWCTLVSSRQPLHSLKIPQK